MYQDPTNQHTRAMGAKADEARRLEEVLIDHLGTSHAASAVPWLASTEDVLSLAEASQRAVDRLGLGIAGNSHPLELLTRLGVRTLGGLSMTRAPSPDEVPRRAAAYANQRCGARAATLLANSLDLDRRLHRMSLRDLV